MIFNIVAALPLVATLTQAVSINGRRQEPKCTDFIIPVSARSSKMIPTGDLAAIDFTNTDVALQYLLSHVDSVVAGTLGTVTTVLVEGDYLISARYCEPTVYNASRANTIQYMQHAITMNKNYWHGLGYPDGFDGDKYAYDVVASNEGYSTIAIDNLGHGNSSQPDPLAVVQMSLQTEIAHQIISALRSGDILGPVNGKKFDKVIYVGHSYGSILGNALAATYPTDVDALVLTGYSGQFLEGAVPLLSGLAVPAPLAKPRFAGQSLGYFAQTYEPGRVFGLYTVDGVGGFDPAIAQHDFDVEDTVAVGELATLFYGVTPATSFEGSVFVVTGRQDAICCYNLLVGADCMVPENKLEAAQGFFPDAADYSYHMPEATGHNANLHYSSPESFRLIHEYLESRGF